MSKTIACVLLMALVLCSPPMEVSAQTLTFTLDCPSVAAASGSRVAFSGTVTNTGAEEIHLNGAFFETATPPLSLDPTSFFFNFAGVLGGGASITADLFEVNIDSGAAAGAYEGFFVVQGGTDEGSFDDLAAQAFQVRIGGAEVVPEGRSWGLMLAALLAVPLCRRRRMQPCT